MKKSITILSLLICFGAAAQDSKAKFHYYDSLYLDAEDSFLHYRPVDITKSVEILIRQNAYLDSTKKYLDLRIIENDFSYDSIIAPEHPIGTPISFIQTDSAAYYRKKYKQFIFKSTQSKSSLEAKRLSDSASKYYLLLNHKK